MDRVRRQLGISEYPVETGKERTVAIAVLDSGVNLHPDLSESVMAFHDFTGYKRPNGEKLFSKVPYDEYGHGTHVCGILAGNGKMSSGKFRGIALGAKLIVGKVLDQNGDGSVEDMLSGMRWVLENKSKYHIRLLNISVGISKDTESTKIQKLTNLLEQLTKEGILTVCAAGNMGPGAGSLSALGASERVISVGCNDGRYYRNTKNVCERYSGRGKLYAVPRKPDVVAPGTQIVSCSGAYRRGRPIGEAYQVRSGTSMAAPIVTGCLAMCLQKRPELTPEQLRKLVTSSAVDLGEAWNKPGWGMVNPAKMLAEAEEIN